MMLRAPALGKHGGATLPPHPEVRGEAAPQRAGRGRHPARMHPLLPCLRGEAESEAGHAAAKPKGEAGRTPRAKPSPETREKAPIGSANRRMRFRSDGTLRIPSLSTII